MDWVGFLNTQGEAVSFNIQDREKTVIFITSQKNQEKTRLKPNMVIMGGWILQNPCQNQVKTTLDFWVFFSSETPHMLFPNVHIWSYKRLQKKLVVCDFEKDCS